MCLTVLERLGSGNPVFIGIDLLYLGSLPVFRNVSLVLRSLNVHILQLFYVDSHSVCSRIKPLVPKHTSLLQLCQSMLQLCFKTHTPKDPQTISNIFKIVKHPQCCVALCTSNVIQI